MSTHSHVTPFNMKVLQLFSRVLHSAMHFNFVAKDSKQNGNGHVKEEDLGVEANGDRVRYLCKRFR